MARDIILFAVIIVAFALGFFVIHFAFSGILNTLITTPEINQTEGAVQSLQGSQLVLAKLDYITLAVMFGLVLAIMITGWFIGTNPIFMVIYFVATSLITFLSIFFANIWETITQNASFGTTITSFPITNHILLNLPIYVAIVGFIGLVVMFAKPYVGGGE